jgi:hypothetical protein
MNAPIRTTFTIFISYFAAYLTNPKRSSIDFNPLIPLLNFATNNPFPFSIPLVKQGSVHLYFMIPAGTIKI